MIGRLVWYIIYKCDLSIEGERVTRKKLKKIIIIEEERKPSGGSYRV
jgi:hypothetical protein